MRSGVGRAAVLPDMAGLYLVEDMRLPLPGLIQAIPVPEHIQGIAALLRVERLPSLLVIREALAGMLVGDQALGRPMRGVIVAAGRMCRVIAGEWVTLLPALCGLAAIILRIR